MSVSSEPAAPAVRPRLVAMTDRNVASAAETLRRFERVARAARPFSVMFELRDRELAASERLAFGRELRALCAAERQWFAVNDRSDLALLLGAHGVHLGEASVTAEDARSIVGARAFVARACHDPECALEPGVNAWLLSPILAGRKGRAALGVGAVTRLAERCRSARASGDAPLVLALGGVSAAGVRACLAAGADGVAVIGAVLAGNEIDALLNELGVAT